MYLVLQLTSKMFLFPFSKQQHDGRLLLATWNIDQDSVLVLDPQWQLPLDDDSEEKVLSLPPSLPEAAVKEQAGFFVTVSSQVFIPLPLPICCS